MSKRYHGTWAAVNGGASRPSLRALRVSVVQSASVAGGADTQYVPIQVVRFPDEVHLAKAALANARTHTVETGVDVIKDDDGETTLRTLTPSEQDGVVTVTPS